ncbi:hypothetical protein KEM52_000420 [Ascosphaera acerosa]|nr:hypothetical protein KEM52_000420 [Ascosphaera acerosa]
MSPKSLTTPDAGSSRIHSDGSYLNSLRSPSSMRAVYEFDIFEDTTAGQSCPSVATVGSTGILRPSLGAIQQCKLPKQQRQRQNGVTRSASEELSAAYQELVDELGGRFNGADEVTSPSKDAAECSGTENIDPAARVEAEGASSLHPASALTTTPDITRKTSLAYSHAGSLSAATVTSDRSAATVERHPSKRNLTPITTISSVLHNLTDGGCSSPTSDISPSVSASAITAVASDVPPALVVRHNDNSTSNARAATVGTAHYLSTGGHHLRDMQHASSASEAVLSYSSKSWVASAESVTPGSPTLSQRILSSAGAERRNLLRIKSMASFRASARAFKLALPGSFDPSASQTQQGVDHAAATTAGLLGEQKEQYGKASADGPVLSRTTSTLPLRNKASFKNTLRRIRTLANLSVPYPPHSLKGKDLEEIAKGGGTSYFKLPHEYAPAPLRLPKGISGALLYLLRYGIRVPGVYQEPGNRAAVAEIYNRYALPVLKPRHKRSTLEEIVREFDYPLESMRQAQLRGESFAHDVCTVLLYFLADLPNGLLGSHTLFTILEDISNHRFSHYGVHRDPGRGEYVSQVPGPSAAKIRLLALAIISLTDDLHLELICAVFGLLSLTVDECSLRASLHRQIHIAKDASCSQCDRLPNLAVTGGTSLRLTLTARRPTYRKKTTPHNDGKAHRSS